MSKKGVGNEEKRSSEVVIKITNLSIEQKRSTNFILHEMVIFN
jgi:hypothetical protein